MNEPRINDKGGTNPEDRPSCPRPVGVEENSHVVLPVFEDGAFDSMALPKALCNLVDEMLADPSKFGSSRIKEIIEYLRPELAQIGGMMTNSSALFEEPIPALPASIVYELVVGRSKYDSAVIKQIHLAPRALHLKPGTMVSNELYDRLSQYGQHYLLLPSENFGIERWIARNSQVEVSMSLHGSTDFNCLVHQKFWALRPANAIDDYFLIRHDSKWRYQATSLAYDSSPLEVRLRSENGEKHSAVSIQLIRTDKLELETCPPNIANCLEVTCQGPLPMYIKVAPVDACCFETITCAVKSILATPNQNS